MNTRLTQLALVLALGALLVPDMASAQAARSRISRNGVTGLEMSLEGGLTAPRGGTLRWNITAYEVLGLSDLRPAPSARLHISSSIDRSADPIELPVDSYGRASIALPIPDDAPPGFTAVLRLVTEGGIQRRFELPIRTVAPESLSVEVARMTVLPGGSLRVFGRLQLQRTAGPIAERAVRLTFRDQSGRTLAPPAEVTTDAAGMFAHTFSVPRDARGGLMVDAVTTETDYPPVRARAQSQAVEPSPEPMLVSVAPNERLLRPGQLVPLLVVVRTPNGRPVAGAVVTLPSARRDDENRRAVTDRRGRAELTWVAPRRSAGFADQPIQVSVAREGLGVAQGTAMVRVAAERLAAALAVEGGSLSPELGGRVFVRVVRADGATAPAGVPVRVSGPRVPGGGVSGATDADGVVALDITPSGAASATADRCGGETATAIEVVAGSGRDVSRFDTCLPLDPDAAARVRVAQPVVRSGAPIEVEVARVRAASRLPVVVELLTAGDGVPVPVAAIVLAPNTNTGTLTPREPIPGRLIVRARPLLGATRQVLRGGVTSVWALPGDPTRTEVRLAPSGEVSVGYQGASGPRTTYVVAAPLDEAWALRDRLDRGGLRQFGDLRREVSGASDALLRAALASHIRADMSAPFVLRGGAAVAVPAPPNAEAVGLLRDPWRARSRFVTGRLALIVRALEGFVAAALPERIDDVAVRSARGFRFNAQILESVAASGNLGSAGATGLGGDPLTIEQLQSFDPSLTYDNVARRITRHRLFKLVLALRALVAQNGFDLPWSRLGDPSTWIRSLMNRHVPGVGSIAQRDLVDGWGRPFALRATSGGRSRFSFVDPLGSWELVSMGPDGRFGGRDDVWDPTARVLRTGTPYANAVGEDILVARLSGVELGRATIELLRNVVPGANSGGVPHQGGEASGQLAMQLWGRIPSRLRALPEPLALRRPSHPGDGAGGALHRLDPSGGTVRLELDSEPRAWGAVAYTWTDAGWPSVALGSARAGAPLIVEAPLPRRLRTAEPVEMEVTVTNVTDAPLPLRLRGDGDGVRVELPDEMSLPPGEARSITVGLAPAATVGTGDVTLGFVGPRDESVHESRWSVQRVSGDHPLRLRAASLVRDRDFSLGFTVPADARRAAGRVVVLAPSALAADPDLADVRRNDPAIVAFSDAIAGRSSDAELWARLLRAQDGSGLVQGTDPALSSACAAVAWARAHEHDADARAALARLRQAIGQAGNPGGGDPSIEEVQRYSAFLAALASAGIPRVSSSGQRRQDPVLAAAARLQVALRRTLRVHPEDPTLLARAAGALLLADPRDTYGLAMLERAADHLTETSDGGARVTPREHLAFGTESLEATFALALAAHQTGRSELAGRLLRGGFARSHVALRAGGRAAFWMLAAGAYGALGESSERVTVTIDGRSEEVTLESGRAVLSLPVGAGSHRVTARAHDGAAFIRVEAAMERPFAAQERGPFTLSIDGEAGAVGTLAALELTVHAEQEVGPAIVDLSLPAGVTADRRLRDLLMGASGVERVEARSPGFVRLYLSRMGAGTDRRIPLPLRWTVRGRLTGLGAVAYPAGRPEAMSTLSPRELRVAAEEAAEN